MLSELWSDLRYRARALFRRADVEAELEAELRFHIEREAEELERQGLPRAEALRRAGIAFGGLERMKEVSRDSRGTQWLESLRQDVRYGLRSLARQPAFTLAVVLTLGIGIGANSAVFTLLNGLLLRPLPVPHPERLVTIGDPAEVHSSWHGSPLTDYVSYPLYAEIRDQNRVLSGVYATGWTGDLDVRLGGADGAAGPEEHPHGRLVTGNFFSVLQVAPYVGRTFTAAEDRSPGADPVVVLSWDFWWSRFAGGRSVLGRAIVVNGTRFRVIGVTPRGFTGDIVGEPTDVWFPMMMESALRPRDAVLADPSVSWLVMMGRLAPGVRLAQARGALVALEARLIRAGLTGAELKEFEADLRSDPVRVQPGARGFSRARQVYGRVLFLLMAAVALVALVVCANVSSLMLARAVARRREMTLRVALGAGRWRLLQQVLTETAVLALAAGALGLLAASWGTRLLLALAAGGGALIGLDVVPDARVLAFTGVCTLLCLVLSGLGPALGATRVDLGTTLRAQGRTLPGAAGRIGGVPLRRALVVGQVTLSMMLLLGTGVLLRSLQRLLHSDLGLDRDHIVTVHVAASRTDYAGARLDALRNELAERAQRIPGVRAASFSEDGLFSGGESTAHIVVPGFAAAADSELQVHYDRVGPRYFEAIGARVLRGRDFEAHDGAGGAPVAVLNRSAAEHYFRGGDPVGRSVVLDSTIFRIVGVVRDVEEQDVHATPLRRLYVDRFETTAQPHSFELQVRVAGYPVRYVAPLRAALQAVDPALPVTVAPLPELVRRSVSEDLLVTQVTTFFGVVALLLAALGLYGVSAYSARQRTGELGLRAALGASPSMLCHMMLGEAVATVAIGVAMGLPLGLGALHFAHGQIFGVGPLDPASAVLAVLVLFTAAAVAGYAPARRAARVHPLEALRTE